MGTEGEAVTATAYKLGPRWTAAAVTFNAAYRTIQRGPAILCTRCRRWYFAALNPYLSCCVIHPPGACCHYGQADATDEAIALAIRAAHSRYSVWTRARAFAWNALALICLGQDGRHDAAYYAFRRRAFALCPELYA